MPEMSWSNTQQDGPFEPDPDYAGVGIGRTIGQSLHHPGLLCKGGLFCYPELVRCF